MRWILLLFLLVLAGGCKTMQPVAHDDWESLPGQVEAGDTVEVVTTDGRTETFVVTAVTDDALEGRDVRVARTDIAQLRVRAVHKGRTFGAAAGGAAIWILMLIGASSAALLSGG